jgi:hypothetical protein
MPTMVRLRAIRKRHSALVALCVALCLGLNQGCARSEPLHRTDASAPASEQALPFHSDTDAASASDGASGPVASDPKQAASLPFRAASHPRVLAAGTLLTVQLEKSLFTSKVHSGDEFTASVAAPLTIDHDTLVQRGSAVTGRVESARSLAARPGLASGSGYFRLTLSTITVEGRQLSLQSSSLFARGTVEPFKGVGVQKGHRLTFRLTAPVSLDQPSAMANRQSPRPTTE